MAKKFNCRRSADAAHAELFKAFPVDLGGRFLWALSGKIEQKLRFHSK